MSALALAIAVLLAPDPPPPPTAFRHARLAAHARDPELVLAVTWQESRHVSAVVSRRQCGSTCRRVASRWHGPPRPDWRPPYFCGVTQVTATTWRACAALVRDDARALAQAEVELERWLAACGTRGQGPRLSCALAGYGAGWRGARRGWSRYSRSVVRRRAALIAWRRAVMLVI